MECFFCFVCIGVFDKCFPDFCLLKNENFDDSSIRAEELIEIVVGDDVSELVVDTDQENWTLRHWVVATSHILINKIILLQLRLPSNPIIYEGKISCLACFCDLGWKWGGFGGNGKLEGWTSFGRFFKLSHCKMTDWLLNLIKTIFISKVLQYLWCYINKGGYTFNQNGKNGFE